MIDMFEPTDDEYREWLDESYGRAVNYYYDDEESRRGYAQE